MKKMKPLKNARKDPNKKNNKMDKKNKTKKGNTVTLTQSCNITKIYIIIYL